MHSLTDLLLWHFPVKSYAKIAGILDVLDDHSRFVLKDVVHLVLPDGIL